MTDGSSRNQSEGSRTIPDGGLATSGLPDWMQSKPEWSRRPPLENALVTTSVRETPAPDISRIDLATILTLEDLPNWLQEVARRPESIGSELDAGSTMTEMEDYSSGTSDRTHVEVHSNFGTRPWWASDRIMAGLMIAIVLTILFVLVVTITG